MQNDVLGGRNVVNISVMSRIYSPQTTDHGRIKADVR